MLSSAIAIVGGFLIDGFGGPPVPNAVVLIEDDRIAAAEIVRAAFLDKVGSRDRRFVVFPGYGHADITLADEAHRDVFAAIAEWVAERSRATASPGAAENAAPGAPKTK